MPNGVPDPAPENSLDVITVLNADGVIRYGSPAVEWILGYQPEELIDKSFAEFVHPDDLPRVTNAFNDEIQIPGCVMSVEFRFQHRDGPWLSLEALAQNRLDDPSVLGLVLSSRDVTERVKTESRLRRSYNRAQRILDGTLVTLAAVVESRDPSAAGHQRRVAELACAIAEEMGLSQERIRGLRIAGTIHDIGKVTVPAEILRKQSGSLNDLESALIKTHPQTGCDLLKQIEFPWPVAQIVLQHHERLDGSGYPQGLAGESTLMESRILAIADVVEVMSYARSPNSYVGVDRALEVLERNKGILYDPVAVDACLKLFVDGYAMIRTQ
jgi:PAS domain S-box-containing protein/putative nucleotidyltransferase with HDIG domain